MTFRFHPWATFFSAIGLALLIALGTWQLNRYQDARQFEADRDARIDEPVVELTADDIDRLADGDFDFRRVSVTGRWDDQRLFLINHRIYDGHPGYWIVRPLLIGDDTSGADPVSMPVNQGWIHRDDGPERAEQLYAETWDEPVELTGLVHRLDDVVPDHDFRQTLEDGAAPDGVSTLNSYDIDAIDRAGDAADLPSALVLTVGEDDPEDHDELTASYDHITDPYLTADTHFGYMLTWYTLAVALIAMWFAHGLGLLRSRSYDDNATA